MTIVTKQYGVVVLGAMNPRIHHPAWYRLTNLITEEESSFAAKQPDTVCAGPFAQFRTAQFRILCQPDRWEIQDLEANDLELLPHLVHEIFDVRLNHTPVSAYGINFSFGIATQCDGVGERLASIMLRCGFGLFERDGAHTKASFGFQRVATDNTLTGMITEGAKPTEIQIAYNYHYLLRESGPFDLGPMIAKRAPVDRQDAIERNNAILKALGTGK